MFKSIGDIIKDIDGNSPGQKRNRLKSYKNDTFDFLNLIKSWKDIVGNKIGSKTIPLKIKNKGLVILTTHPVFSQQLSFIEKPLIKKVTDKFPTLSGKIDRVYFQTNPTFFEQKKDLLNQSESKETEIKKQKLHKFSPEYKKAKSEANQTFQDLGDDDLKELFESIFIQNKLY